MLGHRQCGCGVWSVIYSIFSRRKDGVRQQHLSHCLRDVSMSTYNMSILLLSPLSLLLPLWYLNFGVVYRKSSISRKFRDAAAASATTTTSMSQVSKEQWQSISIFNVVSIWVLMLHFSSMLVLFRLARTNNVHLGRNIQDSNRASVRAKNLEHVSHNRKSRTFYRLEIAFGHNYYCMGAEDGCARVHLVLHHLHTPDSKTEILVVIVWRWSVIIIMGMYGTLPLTPNKNNNSNSSRGRSNTTKSASTIHKMRITDCQHTHVQLKNVSKTRFYSVTLSLFFEKKTCLLVGNTWMEEHWKRENVKNACFTAGTSFLCMLIAICSNFLLPFNIEQLDLILCLVLFFGWN